MTDFIIKKLPYELNSHAGLALIGQYLKSTQLKSLFDAALPDWACIATSDVLKYYLGLLCLGKNDFDAIEDFRDDRYKGRYPYLKRSNVQKRIDDAHAVDHFTGVHVHRPQPVATGGVCAGQYDRVKKGHAARLV